MSAEFEKIVLEKLNILDELKVEVKNLSKKVNNLEEKVDNLEEKVDNNTNSIKTLSQKVDNLEEKVTSNTNSINTLSEKVNSNTDSINNLSKNININTELIASLSKQVEQQGLNFAKFEHEFTVKIQSLFDSFVANTESHLAYEKSIAVLHAKSYDHNDRITILENYFKSTNLLATN